eukprot:CFRG5211T1
MSWNQAWAKKSMAMRKVGTMLTVLCVVTSLFLASAIVHLSTSNNADTMRTLLRLRENNAILNRNIQKPLRVTDSLANELHRVNKVESIASGVDSNLESEFVSKTEELSFGKVNSDSDEYLNETETHSSTIKDTDLGLKSATELDMVLETNLDSATTVEKRVQMKKKIAVETDLEFASNSDMKKKNTNDEKEYSVYNIDITNENISYEDTMRIRYSARWETMSAKDKKRMRQTYPSSRRPEVQGDARAYSVLQSHEEVVKQSPVDPEKTTIHYTNPDETEVKQKPVVVESEDGIYKTCENATMYIKIKDEAGNPVADGSQSFTIELRGPAIISPDVTYTENGIYKLSFVPFTAGSYVLSAVLDFTGHVGSFNCVQHWSMSDDGTPVHVETKREAQERKAHEQAKEGNVFRKRKHVLKRRIREESDSTDSGDDEGQIEGDISKNIENGQLPELREQTRYRLNQQLRLVNVTVIPRGQSELADDVCKNAKRKSMRSGEWVVKNCDDPDDMYTTMACKQSMVEQVMGRADHKHFNQFLDMQECPDLEPKMQYMFTPFDKRATETGSSINGRFVTKTWIHYMGDSLDEGMIARGLTHILSKVTGEPEITVLHPVLDEYNPKITVYRWSQIDLTVSFIKSTKQWRIPGWRFFGDMVDSSKKLLGDEWPSGEMMHRFYQDVTKISGKPHPSVFVFNLGLHAISHDMDKIAYETLLRKAVSWWRDYPSIPPIPMIFRRTTTTHHNTDELPHMHRCLLPDNIKIYDDIAMKVMKDVDVTVLDTLTVSQGRRSATNDNRHFRDSVCHGTRVQAHMMNMLVNKIASMRNWDLTKPIGHMDTYYTPVGEGAEVLGSNSKQLE